METLEQGMKYFQRLYDVVLVSLLLTLNIFHNLFLCFYCNFRHVNAGCGVWITQEFLLGIDITRVSLSCDLTIELTNEYFNERDHMLCY